MDILGSYSFDKAPDLNGHQLVPYKESSSAPTSSDDATAGYHKGYIWKDTTTGYIYYAEDVTASNAVWTLYKQDIGMVAWSSNQDKALNDTALFFDLDGTSTERIYSDTHWEKIGDGNWRYIGPDKLILFDVTVHVVKTVASPGGSDDLSILLFENSGTPTKIGDQTWAQAAYPQNVGSTASEESYTFRVPYSASTNDEFTLSAQNGQDTDNTYTFSYVLIAQ